MIIVLLIKGLYYLLFRGTEFYMGEQNWRWSNLLIALSGGIVLGLGVFTLRYAEGLSYFSTDPGACANCHIMQPQFDSWQKASHHGVATCVDCHLPSDFIAKYIAKAENGYYHS
jgi:cytochrome c nitrite reductase small subunit